jgi:hypothetical protein
MLRGLQQHQRTPIRHSPKPTPTTLTPRVNAKKWSAKYQKGFL